MYQPRRAAALDATTVPDQSSSAPRLRRGSHSRAPKLSVRGPWLRRGLVAVSAVVVAGLVTAAATLPQAAIATESASDPELFAMPFSMANVMKSTVDLPPAGDPAASAVDETIVSFKVMYADSWLTIRESADAKSKSLGSITYAAKVWASTDATNGFRQIQYSEGVGWVPEKNLMATLPTTPKDVSIQPCSRGSSVESGLRTDTIKIYRSVCALFPDVNSYGGRRVGGLDFHKNGRALDIMLTPGAESALGWRIANYLVSYASLFRIDHIIFEQKIWTPSNPTWRPMADRGGITANHYDHVHVAIKA